MNKSVQAFVILANGTQVDSDRNIVSAKVANEPIWIETIGLMNQMFSNFSKLDTLTLNIGGNDREFQTKYLASAGLIYEDTDEPTTVSDEEALGGVDIEDKDFILSLIDK